MELNLPIFDHLAESKRILIAGMGGGFDIFCGLPLYLTLKARGYEVHLANYSFSPIADFAERGHGLAITPTLLGVTPDIDGTFVYFPELYLSQWLKTTFNEDVTVWAFHKTGGKQLLQNYRVLTRRLGIDAIILVDGGVDSLMQGDELMVGTMLEDSVSLACVDALQEIPVRITACIAFGAELHMAYAHVMENIAALTRQNAFYGTCSLLPQMPVYQHYEAAVTYAQGQPYQDYSVINSSVISAVQGRYGDYHLTPKTKGSTLWISALMSMYWFFDTRAMAKVNRLCPFLLNAESMREMFTVAARILENIERRNGDGHMPI